MRYRVGVIGAGKIGALFDSPKSEKVLTHAHSVLKSQRFYLQGFWDSDDQAAKFAAERWGSHAYTTLDCLCIDSDILIVCVPDEFHHEILEKIAKFKPKLVICEKPLTLSSDSAIRVAELYKANGIPLYVNFQRRFDEDVIQLKRDFISGSLGAPIGGAVWYSKGIKHNGSHAVDLVRYLFGEPESISSYSKTYDYSAIDPTVSGRLDFQQVSINLLAANESYFSLFEVDLIFEYARYRFIHSGLELEIQTPRPDPIFAGYSELSITRCGNSNLMFSLLNFMNYIGELLDGKCSGMGTLAEDAILTQKICEKLAGE